MRCLRTYPDLTTIGLGVGYAIERLHTGMKLMRKDIRSAKSLSNMAKIRHSVLISDVTRWVGFVCCFLFGQRFEVRRAPLAVDAFIPFNLKGISTLLGSPEGIGYYHNTFANIVRHIGRVGLKSSDGLCRKNFFDTIHFQGFRRIKS